MAQPHWVVVSLEQHKILKAETQPHGAPGCMFLSGWSSSALIFLLPPLTGASDSEAVNEHYQNPLLVLRSRWRSTLQGAHPYGDVYQCLLIRGHEF